MLRGAVLEFPARAGALLAGVSDGTARAVRDAGFFCGQAFVHAEDVLLRGERSRLDTTLGFSPGACWVPKPRISD
jgi:hypothetical protein